MKKPRVLILSLLVLGGVGYAFTSLRPSTITLTGIVTTNDVIVSPQIAGQIGQLLVDEGDTVKKGQLLAVITPDELRADTRLLRAERRGPDARRSGERKPRCASGAADRRPDPPGRVDARGDRGAGRRPRAADLENARARPSRARRTCRARASPPPQELDQARTARDAAQAQARRAQEAGRRAARGRRARARERRAGRGAPQPGRRPASTSRRPPPRSATKADVRLAYTEIHAPIDGIVDVRAVRVGRGRQPRPADRHAHQPRRPLGARRRRGDLHRPRAHRRHARPCACRRATEREGTVFYRGVDAGFATQRDVSRTKRDIKTFEVRLRVDNRDRRARRRHDGVRAAAGAAERRSSAAPSTSGTSSRSSATSPPSTASASPSRRARSSACSARTAPASRR